MSGRDGLERAVRALRASGDGPAPQSVAMRARVLGAMESRGRARRRLLRWGLPLAATLAFSSAWAASHGYLGVPLRAVRGLVPASPEAAVAPAAGGGSTKPAVPVASPQASSGALDPSPPVVAVEELPVAPAAPPVPPRTERSARAPVPEVDPTGSAATPRAPAEEDALYAAAHRAHFVDHDPAAALRAWDAYLRAAPSGVLAPEAQYNRALCLVRLGRRAEGVAALRPFAEGRYGGYRQREAAELVAGLGNAP